MPSLERILRAAINDVRNGKAEPHCGELPRWIKADEPLNEIEWADGYAEPGYSDPEKGVLFGNWNNYPSRLTDILERAGYAIEWSDEWATCDGCHKALRTSADSYSWQMYGHVGDGSIECRDCTDWDDRLQQLEDDPTAAVPADVDPADYGYVRVSEPREYESGFHPGQTDDPRAILKALHARGIDRVVFRVPTVQQFDVCFETWRKADDDNDSE